MTENIETSRWTLFLNAYGKKLGAITFSLVLLFTFIYSLASIFEIFYVDLPLLGHFSLIWVIMTPIAFSHGIIIGKIVKKKQCLLEFFTAEDFLVVLALVSYFIYLSALTSSFIFQILFKSYPEIVRQLMIWFLIAFFTAFTFLMMHAIIISRKERASLLFKVVLDGFPSLRDFELRNRCKWIDKYFRRLKEGLRISNAVFGKLPNHPQIKEIDSYYDRAYLTALTGNGEELEDLRQYIVEIDESVKERDLKRILITLQRLKGKTSDEDTSYSQLSELFRTVPFSSRAFALIKSLAPIIIGLITLIAGIIRIMNFLGS